MKKSKKENKETIDENKKEIEKDNYIIGEIKVNLINVGTEIKIINSYDSVKKSKRWIKGENNEKDIKENCEIEINEEIIDFNYCHKFVSIVNHKIKYTFKKKLININNMFDVC